MKNIQLTGRETDLKVLETAIKSGYPVVVGSMVWLSAFVSSGDGYQLPFINFVLSIGVALFVWSMFKLVEPRRYSRDWQIVEFIFIPLVWLLLMVAIDVGIHYVIQWNASRLMEITQIILAFAQHN